MTRVSLAKPEASADCRLARSLAPAHLETHSLGARRVACRTKGARAECEDQSPLGIAPHSSNDRVFEMAVPQSQRRDRDGEIVGGRYQLLGMLGRGGQGSVYRARDLRDNDEVAIKVLADSFAEDSDWRERMFREARAMSTLSGTAAVRVFDQQWTADGSLCLVMELLHGHDLDEWLHALESRGKRFPVAVIPEIFKPIVDTLEVAHLNRRHSRSRASERHRSPRPQARQHLHHRP
jgi:serine/threonine protein kinase